MFLFCSFNNSFRNKYFIEKCFNTFINKLFTVTIFLKVFFLILQISWWNLGMSWECLKNNYQTSALHDHMLFHKAVVCPEDFSILAKSSCSFKLEIQEGILIKLLTPTLNKNLSSVPLYLFWYYSRLCKYTLFRE